LIKYSLKDREIQGFKRWSVRWQTSGMISLSKTSRSSSWTGWSGSPWSLTTMETIIFNEPIVSGITLIGVEKDGVVRTFSPFYELR
jgi:hypothetical protein